MKFTKKQLDKFKRIYKKEFGKDISDTEALDSATKLITLMKLICKPIPKNKKSN